jgi:7,8-dihydropterin-6-yl-methyl-4-(beta-D-ribofuranosyl)aminobenzene 5'-phosphate synthase
MGVKLTTLTENTAGVNGLLSEHGLSILVEANGVRILLDTGQTYTAVHNARRLGVDLSSLDAIVLSHGHSDHVGGLKEVLREVTRERAEVTVAAHPAIWTVRYSRPEGKPARFNGIPFRLEDLETRGARFRLATYPMELAPGITTTGEVPRVTDFESVDPKLQVQNGKGWHQDEILDDMSLIVRGERGLVVVAGCAHSGIVNTLLHARRVTGEDRVYAVVGGTHLSFAPGEQLERTVEALREFRIQRLGVSHCTGLPAAARLAREFGESFFFNSAGTVVELD